MSGLFNTHLFGCHCHLLEWPKKIYFHCHSVNERFNRILKEELLSLGNFHPEPEVFNPKLGNWLEEFNFRRPNQALGYKTPKMESW
jgi:hypothetical protein